jgi:HEAT repeat protein
MRFFFPELFAIIGSAESTHILKHLMDDPFHPIRIEAILSAARHGRDDLLGVIRSSSTHIDVAEQEACAAALGYLKDTSSLKRLKKLSQSPSESVQLAALGSLYLMGDEAAKEKIIAKAQEKNCFAITLLSDIEGSEKTLRSLLHDDNISVRFNASLSLLKRKDPIALRSLREFILKDSRDIGFQPQTSVGGSLKTWKVISSLQQHAKQSYIDLLATSLFVRESILKDAVELPEGAFLQMAQEILSLRQNELVPLLVSLIENQKSDAGIDLLKVNSQTAGAPLIRAYCTLALCRLKQEGPFESNIKEWIKTKFQHQIVEFRPSMPLSTRLSDYTYELTPEENSALLIESYQYLAESHTEENIEFIIEALERSDPKNLPLLAGILLRAVQ